MNDFVATLERAYGFEFISFTPYVPKNPKYTNSDHFWVVVCSTGTYFLKRHTTSILHSIDREVEVLRSVGQYISVPDIILTTSGQPSVELNGDAYVMYCYIDAPNLRDRGVSTYEYFDIVCGLQNQLIVNGCSGKVYNISGQLEQAEKTFYDIKVEVEQRTDDLTMHDLGYIDFLLLELADLKGEIRSYSAQSCLVHGDLLKQNIIVSAGTIWVIDWEKAVEYIPVIDLLRSILYTITDSSKPNLGLSEDVFVEYLAYCCERVELDSADVSHALDLFYFHLVTNTDYLSSVYLYDRKPLATRTKEDYYICQWFKEHKASIQLRVDNHLAVT